MPGSDIGTSPIKKGMSITSTDDLDALELSLSRSRTASSPSRKRPQTPTSHPASSAIASPPISPALQRHRSQSTHSPSSRSVPSTAAAYYASVPVSRVFPSQGRTRSTDIISDTFPSRSASSSSSTLAVTAQPLPPATAIPFAPAQPFETEKRVPTPSSPARQTRTSSLRASLDLSQDTASSGALAKPMLEDAVPKMFPSSEHPVIGGTAQSSEIHSTASDASSKMPTSPKFKTLRVQARPILPISLSSPLPSSSLNSIPPLPTLPHSLSTGSQPSGGSSSGKLTPRSPFSLGNSPDYITFLRTTLEKGPGTSSPFSTSNGIPGETNGETSSLRTRSSHSSIRSARLKREIERAAQELREKDGTTDIDSSVRKSKSFGSLPSRRSANSVAPDQLPLPLGSDDRSCRKSPGAEQEDGETRSVLSNGSAGSFGFGAPLPSSSARSRWLANSEAGSEAESSLQSHGLGTESFADSSSKFNGGALKEKTSRRESMKAGTRQPESKEWSQVCWVWHVEKPSTGGMLGKAPLIRDVPGVMKRKIGKRDSSQLLTGDTLTGLDTLNAHQSSKSSTGKDKFGKGGISLGPSSSSKEGCWKKVVSVLRDDGYLRIFSDESVIMHSVHLPSINRSDIRPVDQSLFQRPNVLVFHRKSISPSTPSAANLSFSRPSNATAIRAVDEPIYICMPSKVALESWLVMAHCFARPEFLTSEGSKASTSPLLQHRRRGSSQWSAHEDDDQVLPALHEGVLDSHCRIFRSIVISINEGRGIGENGADAARLGPRRPDFERDSSTRSIDTFGTNSTSDFSPVKASAMHAARLHRSGEGNEGTNSMDTFCEVMMNGEIVARTSLRRGSSSPYWNESFTFRDLPPIVSPVTIRVFEAHKHSKPSYLGSAVVRVPDYPRAELVEDWWPIKPHQNDFRGKQSDNIGELNMSVRIDEEVVLPSTEYNAMLQLLNQDTEADLPADLANEFPHDLEEISQILLRIYAAEGQLLSRILRLTEVEVDGDLTSAAILFRGNSILTKSIELYLRLVGSEFLEQSLGEPIRRICNAKVEIEIDPSKMKAGVKEKEIASNVAQLTEWATTVWNAIYDAREKCPNELRTVFNNIQQVVVTKYGQEQSKMRSTSVSAFVFLRFFVPAVLNPKLFGIVYSHPDSKAQRTLTLIAKTLQGLANFSSFGQKEPWMLAMNSFVQSNTSAFIDFIDHISRPNKNTRNEWTSPHSSVYLAPYRLRNSLPPHVRDGVPLLPHLIDLPRDLGLLASHVSRAANHERSGRHSSDRVSTPSRARSARYSTFSAQCAEVHEEALKRGGGLVGASPTVPLEEDVFSSPKLRARCATVRTNIPLFPSTPPRNVRQQSGDSDELHIRLGTPPPTAPLSPRRINSPSSAASKRSHRSFTVSGIPPALPVPDTGHSFPSGDLHNGFNLRLRPSTGGTMGSEHSSNASLGTESFSGIVEREEGDSTFESVVPADSVAMSVSGSGTSTTSSITTSSVTSGIGQVTLSKVTGTAKKIGAPKLAFLKDEPENTPRKGLLGLMTRRASRGP